MDKEPTISSGKKQVDCSEENEIEFLVKSYLSGDSSSFAKLTPFLQKIVSQVVRSRVVSYSREMSEDIQQECWIEVIKNLKRWDPERGSLKNFLFACFSNRALTYIHRNSPRSPTVSIEEIPESELGESHIHLYRDDLIFNVKSRIRDFTTDYVLRRVCVAIYIGVFDRYRMRIFNEIKETTGLSPKRLYFLIDYSLVTIRRYFVENGWNREY